MKKQALLFRFSVDVRYVGNARMPTKSALRKWVIDQLSTNKGNPPPFMSETIRLRSGEKSLPEDLVVHSLKKGPWLAIRSNNVFVKVGNRRA